MIHAGLARVPAEQRENILSLPATPRVHAELLAQMPFVDAVEGAPPPKQIPPPASARVVAWNLERCRSPEGAAAVLTRLEPDVVLLSEMDFGMARTGQRHTTRELAQLLGCGYAFAVEFLELGLGGKKERAEHAGKENDVGYHGGAILSPHPLENPVVVRLTPDGAWFDGGRGERRLGSRIAVLATLRMAGGKIALASVHLESHSDPDHRSDQMWALLEALDEYAGSAPAIIGGDLNTFSLGVGLGDPEKVGRALAEDPNRWAHPVPHEPLFDVADAAGFEWQSANIRNEPTHRVCEGQNTWRGHNKLDWLLCRGLTCEFPRVIDAVDPSTGAALSDHEAVSVSIQLA